MRTILHISDLHFGPPYIHRVGEALIRDAHTINPDLIIISGDFTQRAKRTEFADARAFINQLPAAPRIVVPGNHDVPLYRIFERLFRPLDNYREFIADQLDTVHTFDNLTAIALNSTSPRRAISNGRIHLDQLDLCERTFRNTPDDHFKIIIAHHHFAPAPDFERDQTMPRARRALDRFNRLGVDLILGGHLHRASISNSLDVYPGGERNRGMIIIQCGTTTSRRGRGKEREKNTLNIITLNHTINITHCMYFDDRDRFAPISKHEFPRPGKMLAGE